MTSLDLLLGLEGPELDDDGADEDVVSDRVISQSTQDILRSVRHAVNDRLDALIVARVPDFDHFVCAQTDQMVTLLIDVQMTDRCVMAIEVRKLLQSVGLPQNDMALLAAARHLFMLHRVDKAVDALLMEVECALLAVVQRLQLVHVDETVQG